MRDGFAVFCSSKCRHIKPTYAHTLHYALSSSSQLKSRDAHEIKLFTFFLVSKVIVPHQLAACDLYRGQGCGEDRHRAVRRAGAAHGAQLQEPRHGGARLRLQRRGGAGGKGGADGATLS
jgi:hypothetical protein